MDKRWLTLKEAATYSSIGRNRLQAMAQEGSVKACQDRGDGRHGWIFDRVSLDQYYEDQMTRITSREKALAIMRGIRI